MTLRRFDYLFLTLIFLLNLALKLFRLDIPRETFFDEKAYYLPAARDYIQGIFTTNFEQPMLGKIFIASGIQTFGDNPWGWRVPEVLVGSVGIVFAYLLAKALYEGRLVPVLASVFLTFEFSWFLFSRTAVLEIYVATFSLAGAFFFWRLLQTKRNLYAILTGVLFGLAIGTKWSGAFLLIFLLIFFVWVERRNLKNTIQKSAVIIGMSLLVYFSTFSFFIAKHGLGELFELHSRMLSYHLLEHPEIVKNQFSNVGFSFFNNPLFWVFNYASLYLKEVTGTSAKVIVQFYNPAIFWGILAAIAASFRKLIGDTKKLFLVGAFLVFWLPWLFIPRFAYPYYLLSGIPFGVILLAKTIEVATKKSRSIAWGFTGTLILLFVFYYPIISYLYVPITYVLTLTGFRLEEH